MMHLEEKIKNTDELINPKSKKYNKTKIKFSFSFMA